MAKKPSPQDENTIQSEPTQASGALEQSRPDDHTDQPTQAELDADRSPLTKVEAEALLRAGHRLRIKGDSPLNWVSMTRHAGAMAISYNATPQAIADLLDDKDLILAD